MVPADEPTVAMCFGVVDRSSFESSDFGVVGPERKMRHGRGWKLQSGSDVPGDVHLQPSPTSLLRDLRLDGRESLMSLEVVVIPLGGGKAVRNSASTRRRMRRKQNL